MATDQPGKFNKMVKSNCNTIIYLFPEQGLNIKVLMDRIDELWVDGAFGTRDQFINS